MKQIIIDDDLAYWGGQNELVKAWAEMPMPYEDEA